MNQPNPLGCMSVQGHQWVDCLTEWRAALEKGLRNATSRRRRKALLPGPLFLNVISMTPPINPTEVIVC